MGLILKDSQYIEGIASNWETQKDIRNYLQTIDKLKKSIKDKEVQSISLNDGLLKEIDKEIIWYSYDSSNRATFFTSHYIGYYSSIGENEEVNIEIKPRFGEGVLNYLLSYAYGIYLPKSDSSVSSSNSKNNTLWLITVMWKAMLEKAITKSQIPKEYKAYEQNSSRFRGQLQISKHIKNNLVDKSKFYCKYRKLTMDTTINQTIRYTYNLLVKKEKGLKSLLKDIAEYDNMLHSFGVQHRKISTFDIKNIRYSKLNIYYKKVMELSALIIKSQSINNDSKSLNREGFSYFIDIAELWENYLLKLLQKHLPQYNIYSPNEKGGEYLLENSFREIRPDIIIEQDGEIVAILDAKYKWYNKIGKYASNYGAVSRDDLYQMSSYLYHYSREDKPIVGLFISPIGGDEDLNILSHNDKHQMGVVNLNIEQFTQDSDEDFQKFSRESIEEEERKFISKIPLAIVNK